MSAANRSLADDNPYFFTFRQTQSSRHFRLVKRRWPDLGNYPIPIKIEGRFVQCSNNRYLAKNGAATSFSLYCLPAG